MITVRSQSPSREHEVQEDVQQHVQTPKGALIRLTKAHQVTKDELAACQEDLQRARATIAELSEENEIVEGALMKESQVAEQLRAEKDPNLVGSIANQTEVAMRP